MTDKMTSKAMIAGVKKYFEISLPTTVEELKKAYRKASKTFHPDANPKGNEEDRKVAHEDFIKMQAVYDALMDSSFVEDGTNTINILCTTDGTPLCDLGKGLGITQNGRTCDDCSGHGYRPLNEFKNFTCESCDENGLVPKQYSCKDCRGTGNFFQPKSEKVVPCRKCGGTGKFKHPHHKVACPECYGTKIRSAFVESKKSFSVCGHCDGTGEIPVYNPVMLKGSLFFTGSKQRQK